MNDYEYWHLLITCSLLVFFCSIFTVMHSHVWTRNGYAGKNLILEDHEVDRFIAHVLSEASFIVLYLVSMLEPFTMKYMKFNYTLETKLIFAASFAGSGLWVIFGNRMKKLMKSEDKPETTK